MSANDQIITTKTPQNSWEQKIATILRETLGVSMSGHPTAKTMPSTSLTTSKKAPSPTSPTTKRYRAQPPGRSFWTKCPRCGFLQALDQGSWARVGSCLIYCCASCAYHQLITTELVDFGKSDHVNPSIDVMECERCYDRVVLVLASGELECLNCLQQADENTTVKRQR